MKQGILVLVLVACGAKTPARSTHEREADSAAAVAALRSSKFDAATTEATAALAKDARSGNAAAVRAIATYQLAAHELVTELGKVLEQGWSLKALDHAGGRAAWQKFLDKLGEVDRDLAIVAADPSFALELCIACWEKDYNHSGEVDDRDRKFLELELDDKGERMAEQDPRRRPTFRFDVGDAEWARAMVSFQRAAVELVLAYQWSDLDKLLFGGRDEDSRSPVLTIKLADTSRVTRARDLILNGLAAAERCRALYLAETDDDREWVPNPKQHSHPIPLAMDDSIYATWAGVLGDVRRMLESKEGISLREVARLGDRNSEMKVPDSYLDLGAMLSSPKDIVIDVNLLKGDDTPDKIAQLLRGLIGNGYKPAMKASPLVGRLNAMKQQLDRGEDTFERKLRYLLWLN